MTGLEVALDQVTDRSGKNMREKIETDTEIDDLIVPDDTGPILRRALDNVEHTEPAPPAIVQAAAPGAFLTPGQPSPLAGRHRRARDSLRRMQELEALKNETQAGDNETQAHDENVTATSRRSSSRSC